MKKQREIISEPKYAPPYPQSFYPFWPKHAIKASIIVSIVLLAVVLLAHYYRVPSDPNMSPLPDDGMYIPAPEWYLFLLYQPFWYLTGDNAKWMSIGTFWLPLLLLVLVFLVPVAFKRKKPLGSKTGIFAKLTLALFVWAIWIAAISSVAGSGYHAKTMGCMACHNPMMGVRQDLPPANMAEYYRTERQRQINLGGYRVGDTLGGGGSYKDANWQLRHFYEPTMTW
ncbi:MAG: hypothetical protein GY862_15630 [Gammaproteobacteria bacterium]|nr:hypothetical protein [Gammaproteobacteria bacterium]